jgi:hypothetical protein
VSFSINTLMLGSAVFLISRGHDCWPIRPTWERQQDDALTIYAQAKKAVVEPMIVSSLRGAAETRSA